MTAGRTRNLAFAYSRLAHAPHPDPDRQWFEPWCGATSCWRPNPTRERVSCTKCLRRMALDETARGVLTGPRAQCPQCGDMATTTDRGVIGGHRQNTRTRPWCRGAGATPLRYATNTATWRCTIDTGFPGQAPTETDHITPDLARRHLVAAMLHRAATAPQPELRGSIRRGVWVSVPGHRVAWTAEAGTTCFLLAALTDNGETGGAPAVGITGVPVATPKGTFAGRVGIVYTAHDRARVAGDTGDVVYHPADDETCPVTIPPIDFRRGPDGTWTHTPFRAGITYIRDGQTRQFSDSVERMLTDTITDALHHDWTPPVGDDPDVDRPDTTATP